MHNKRGKFERFFIKDRKGQELSTNTLILIILGVAILIVLIAGFTIGWQKILPWLSSTNIDTVSTQCKAACTTGDVYGFCSLERTLRASDLPEGKKEIISNCQFFSTNENYLKYNIEKCPDLCPVAPAPSS